MTDSPQHKTILLTGGTSGVGKATAIGLALKGARIIIVSRSAERGQAALKDIARITGNDQGDFLVGDLSLQSSIRNLAEEFKRRYDHLDVLANLAGGIFFDKLITAEGIERSFAINYLGHFLLTNQLLDILKESRPSRVITVAGSPGFMRRVQINFDDLQGIRHYNGLRSASRAILMRVLFAFELARRLKGQQVTSVAFNPGVIKSNLTANGPWYAKMVAAFYKPFEKEICEVGAYLAASDEVREVTGVFFNEKMKIVPLHKTLDLSVGERLWEETVKVMGGRGELLITDYELRI